MSTQNTKLSSGSNVLGPTVRAMSAGVKVEAGQDDRNFATLRRDLLEDYRRREINGTHRYPRSSVYQEKIKVNHAKRLCQKVHKILHGNKIKRTPSQVKAWDEEQQNMIGPVNHYGVRVPTPEPVLRRTDEPQDGPGSTFKLHPPKSNMELGAFSSVLPQLGSNVATDTTHSYTYHVNSMLDDFNFGDGSAGEGSSKSPNTEHSSFSAKDSLPPSLFGNTVDKEVQISTTTALDFVNLVSTGSEGTNEDEDADVAKGTDIYNQDEVKEAGLDDRLPVQRNPGSFGFFGSYNH